MNSYIFLTLALICAAAYSAWRMRTEPKPVPVRVTRRHIGWGLCAALAGWLAVCSSAIAFAPSHF